MNKNNFIILGLNKYDIVAQRIAKNLNIQYSEIVTQSFADQEIIVTPSNSLRGKNVILVCSTSLPANEKIMQLLIAIDAIKRASAVSINIVIPYFGYARQDRKAKSRQPITAKLIANLLVTAGANRITTFDLHSPQIEGFFDIPVDNLSAIPLIAHCIKSKKITDNLVIVSPDNGGINRARKLAEILDLPLAVIDKRRTKPNESEVMHVLGEVENKNCLLVDDLIDTGGTICNAAKALKKNGALSVYIAATHAVLSKDALNKIEENSNLLILSNSIIEKEELSSDKIYIVDIYDYLKDALKAMIENSSLGEVYKSYSK